MLLSRISVLSFVRDERKLGTQEIVFWFSRSSVRFLKLSIVDGMVERSQSEQ